MKDIFDAFIAELQSRNKRHVADQKIRFFWDLQDKRLESLGLKMKLNITDRGLLQNAVSMGYENEVFENMLAFKTCQCDLSFLKNEKRVYHKTSKETLYELMSDIKGGHIDPNMAYNCPNCGNVLKISELTDGCPYCGTRWILSDLFPVTTYYYFIKDISGTKKELKNEMAPYMMLIGLLMFLVGLLLKRSILHSIVIGIFGGLILGYFFWAISKLFTVFSEAGKSMGALIDSTGSKKKLLKKIKAYDPKFSYEYFTSEVVSLIKIISFADDLNDLAVYDGKETDLFKDVVDVDFAGAIGFQKMKTDDDHIYLDVSVYLDVLRYNGKKISSSYEKYNMTLKRDIHAVTDTAFSITRVECKNCGASFDATRVKKCPYCDSEYDYAKDSWVVTQIRRA